MSELEHQYKKSVPNWFVYTLIFICLAPLILNYFGLNFSSSIHNLNLISSLNLSTVELHDQIYDYLNGSFIHTILEWSAFLIAMFTALLSFIYYSINRDLTTPIVGIALLFAGSMDAFHILAADGLIETVADSKTFLPFTWAISRLFNALILFIGIGLLLKTKDEARRNILIIISSLGFALLAYLAINYSIFSSNLPQAIFPTALIKRPYDIAALMVFLSAAIFIFPKFYKENPSPFSHALWISMIPAVATELYIIFGSTALYDNNFNIAYFLKALSYLVPYLGLCLEYVNASYRYKTSLIEQVQEAEISKKRANRLFDISLDLMCVANFDSYLIQVNQQWMKTLGYTEEELLSQPFNNFVHPDDLHNTKTEIQNLATEGYQSFNFENRYRAKNGEYINLLWTAVPFYEEGLIFATAKDITSRKKSEQELINKTNDLIRINKVAIGREERMIELKEIINKLSIELGREAPFKTSND